MKKQLKQFRASFTEGRFKKKIVAIAKSAGSRTIYTAMLLYFAYQRKDTPAWAKRIVLGALGYLVVPIDAIPDLSPFIGLTDDVGVLSFGLVTIAAYINDEVREKARAQVSKLLPTVEEEDFEAVEKQL